MVLRMISAGQLRQLWLGLPIGSLGDVIGAGPCLVLAPHPDDESVGCGGLIAACCAGARPPLVVVLTDGSGSHRASRLFPPARLISVREAEVTQAVRILGLPVERLMFLREQDTKAPHAGPAFDAVVRRLADFVRAFGCTTIVAPWRFDPHYDHEAAAKIACETARVTGIRQLAYPIWGWTLCDDDTPVEEKTVRGSRLAVAPYLGAKRRAIRAHASQYGQLITDDPVGFESPTALLRALDEPWETFLSP
jgi:LmbE family N-acetylglucosaminyl deacetylase